MSLRKPGNQEGIAIGGEQSDETVGIGAPGAPGARGDADANGGNRGEVELVAELRWTFPLRFAEIITGDGQRVYRQRIDLTDTEAFGTKKLVQKVDLRGKRWVRFEVWDIARNRAYTQPVWVEDE